MPPALDLNRISTQTFARFVEHHESLPSTNDLAMRVATDRRTETPLLIVAERQTAGRGRGSNAWWSAPGALTFTLVFDSEDFSLAPERFPCVALATGLAVCDILPELVPQASAGLKWPNDVWLDGRKLSGILVEVPPCRPPVPSRLVVGVGLNVNNSVREAPPEIRPLATALCDARGEPLDLTEVLVRFLTQLQRNLADLSSPAGPDATLADRWQSLCVLRGRAVTVTGPASSQTGIAHGIQRDGSLLLDVNGHLTRVYGGTVTFGEIDSHHSHVSR